MNILNDDELIAAITSGDIKIDNFSIPENPYTKESPIQPSSLDLTIGEIYVPSVDEISASNATPTDTGRIALKPGHTALVYTHEILKLKDNIGAFGFPPARISGMGLLMTNPGHIDPGFEGKMSFTVINMSRNDITLKPGEPIVTLLIYQLTNSVNTDYSSRGFSASREPKPKDRLNSLSHDFLNLESRSRQIAIKEVRKAGVTIKLIGLFLVIIVALIGIIGPMTFYKDIAGLSERIKIMETHGDMKELSEKIDKQVEDHKEINKRIIDLEGS